MPVLDNPRYELFAQELAKGKTADEAYVLAGYRENRGNASTLKANQIISDRVLELQGAVIAHTEFTIESLLREADRVQQLATNNGQYSAAIAALTAKAKLAGLWVDKAENTNTNQNVDPRDLSDEKLADIATSGSSGTAGKAIDPAKSYRVQ